MVNIFINIESCVYGINRLYSHASCEHVMICILWVLLCGRDIKILQQISIFKVTFYAVHRCARKLF